MMHMEYEAAEGIPSALIACRINGIQAHITGISPRSVLVRTPDAIDSGAMLTFCIHQIETGSYAFHTINKYQAGEARRENGAVLTRLSFDDPACAAAIRRALNDYARYVEIRSEACASAYGREITGYPLDADESFHSSLARQRRGWFENFPRLPESREGIELAVELNCPELWKLYLDLPGSDFPKAYAACRNLSEDYLDHRSIDRLYIGNAYCRHLFPDWDTLKALAAKSEGEGKLITLATARLRAGGEDHADALMRFAAEARMELIVNDWGMLQRARDYKNHLEILLGTQLNRRRKDPRMQYKAGLKGREALLSRNSLNDDPWREYLCSMGVKRFEYESCGQPTDVPVGKKSLHLPFYQTNTSLWCPLQALCTRGDRGAQQDAESCPGWCESNAILYPVHLKMLGRWNSLLALDDGPWKGDFMNEFDRWVLNF